MRIKKRCVKTKCILLASTAWTMLHWKRIVALSIGVSIMLLASYASVHAEAINHMLSMPHTFIDAAAYFFHGVGSIPYVEFFIPLYKILQDEYHV